MKWEWLLFLGLWFCMLIMIFIVICALQHVYDAVYLYLHFPMLRIIKWSQTPLYVTGCPSQLVLLISHIILHIKSYHPFHILLHYHVMFRVSSATPLYRTFIYIYLAAHSSTGYDVWWIDNRIFNYNPHAVLYHSDVHKTRSLFKIRIPNIRYQSPCLTVWHFRKFICDIGIRTLDTKTQDILRAHKGYRPVLSSFNPDSNLEKCILFLCLFLRSRTFLHMPQQL